jgi:dolichol-phosphate mannosyltransferase
MKRWKHLAAAFGRFLLVGLSGTLVNLAVLWELVNLGLPQSVASLVAIELSIINNFLWNDLWTFQASRVSQTSRLVRFARFQTVTTLTALLTFGIFAFLSTFWHFHYLLAQAGAIGVATITNFALNLRITWPRPLEIIRPASPVLDGPLTVAKYSNRLEE